MFMSDIDGVLAASSHGFLSSQVKPRIRTSSRLGLMQSRNLNVVKPHSFSNQDYLTQSEDAIVEARKAELTALMGKDWDWREHRAKLVEMTRDGRLGAPTSSKKKKESEANKNKLTIPGRPCKANLAMLKRQNPDLSSEKKWAHTVPTPEVGGLLLRKPMELQVWHHPEYREILCKRLSPALCREVMEAASLPDGMRELMEKPSQVVTLYTTAEDYLKERMRSIYLQCQVSGSDVELSKQDISLLEYYQAYMDSWQQVVLITDHSSDRRSHGVIINRPTPSTVANLEENYASSDPASSVSNFFDMFENQVLYSGSGESISDLSEENSEEEPKFQRDSQSRSSRGSFSNGMPSYARRRRQERSRSSSQSDESPRGARNSQGRFRSRDLASREARRREREMRKRNGGMDLTILHHYNDASKLGSTRLPGNIMLSDLEAACKAVAKAGASPDHFRVFYGSKTWEPGQVEKEIEEGIWYSIAAARPFILKHCVGLPKPLWHEVLDMVGGGLLEASELEIRKRREAGSSKED
eukprot:CAMPEP_0184487092 /NCGR_PEP_ID=MMETSP0113_2-20130426/9198_1 /TAXON_ID=91329 /ORGANISM="Norrisiella sphaerica, Strain BC52" /LENGTH=526 /DNA_ID=CAMNT_0026869265 /DNA_START=255 /DNA_END=1835 /DNA_ORIENTATION=+